MAVATRPKEGVRFAPTFWPKQGLAMQLLGLLPGGPNDGSPPVEELLYGGAAGGGKSSLLRHVGYHLCLVWPGARVPIFRRTYPALEEHLIPKALAELPVGMATYNKVQHEFTFTNGSILEFRYAANDTDVRQYNTAEWSALLIDQAEELSEYQLRFLRSRVRQPVDSFKGSAGGPWRPIIVLSANPGGQSHQYLRDGWVDAPERLRGATTWQAPAEEGGLPGLRRAFLPALLSDNPSLDRESYLRVLSGLPATLRRAYIDGDWSAIAGARFDQWRASKDGAPWHVWPESFARAQYAIHEKRDPTAYEQRMGQREPVAVPFPPPDWVTWAAIDGGTRDPWVMEAGARAPNGRIFIWAEDYIVGIEVPDQARRLLDFAKTRRISKWVADPAMFANRANMSVSDAQIYAQFGINLERGNNKREQGWRRISELLTHTLDDGYPELVVIEGRAPHLVRTLPLLLAHPIKREDVDGDLHGRADPRSPSSIRDDPADCTRYLVTPAAAGSNESTAYVMNARVDAAIDTYQPRPGEPSREPAYIAELGQTGFVDTWR